MIVQTQFEKRPKLFQNPHYIIQANDPKKITACFNEMEQALKAGYYLAGFFSYEAGYAFEDQLNQSIITQFPLIQFGVYDVPEDTTLTVSRDEKGTVSKIEMNIERQKYDKHIQAIREYIAAGDVYQITYCVKLKFDFQGSPKELYKSLLREQPVPYPAYIETDRFQLLSLSPELFLKKNGEYMLSKPMKGTWQRGKNIASDLWAHWQFSRDRKNRAENVMIADLLRNDLGRIGHNIHVPKLFEIAGYRTLYQMTSTVACTTPKDLSLHQLFAALFPSGSVTGAPKLRAMEVISSLEEEPRHIYTGAIGYITPEKDLFFNIPIRTLLLQDGRGEMGIGGGIVWDSTAQGEWDEVLLKAKFLTGSRSCRTEWQIRK